MDPEVTLRTMRDTTLSLGERAEAAVNLLA